MKGEAKALNSDVMAGVSIYLESAEVFSHLTRRHHLARLKTLPNVVLGPEAW